MAISTILRNLSFVLGTEPELIGEPLLTLLGDLLQLHHRHPACAVKHTNYDRYGDADFQEAGAALSGDERWAEYLPLLHENALVTLCNVSRQLRLAGYDEPVVQPLLEGLLHWVQCSASYATDPFVSCSPSLLISPQRLALEAPCRLCISADNVDLILATPRPAQLRARRPMARPRRGPGESRDDAKYALLLHGGRRVHGVVCRHAEQLRADAGALRGDG